MDPADTSLISCRDTGAHLGDVPAAGWMAQVELDVDPLLPSGSQGKQGGCLYSVPSRGLVARALGWAQYCPCEVSPPGTIWAVLLSLSCLSWLSKQDRTQQSNLLGFGKEGSRTNIITE